MTERNTESGRAERIDEGRREALAKLGKFAAYTAPAMMTLMVSERAMARSVNGGSGGGKKRNPLRKLVRLLRKISSARG
jgi:hypothetical protein